MGMGVNLPLQTRTQETRYPRSPPCEARTTRYAGSPHSQKKKEYEGDCCCANRVEEPRWHMVQHKERRRGVRVQKREVSVTACASEGVIVAPTW